MNLIDNLASTFSPDLLMTGEKDAYYFRKSELSMNSGRPVAQRVTYSAKGLLTVFNLNLKIEA